MLSVLLFVLALPVSAQDTVAERVSPEDFPAVVARVNGTDITKLALLRRADALRNQLPSFEVGADFYHRVLSDLIGGELLYQAAAEAGLLPQAAQVDAEIETQAERLGGAERLAAALDSQGLTIAEVRVEIGKELAVQAFIERELVPTLVVTDEAKRDYYQQNPDLMKQPTQFRAAHILIGVAEGAPPEEKDAARKKALAIRSMLDVGQDFAELARRNSDDPGSRDNGGELPWLSLGDTVPPFEKAALALDEGELSDVVESQFGYHIIHLLERRDEAAAPFEQVAPRIEELLLRRGLQDLIDEKIEDLTASGDVALFI